MKTIHIAITTILAFSASSCTWVNENKAGQSILITDISQVSQCQRIGHITAKTKHKVGLVKRGKAKVAQELEILARNEGVKLGANTLVADDEPTEGVQHFQAFVCVR